MIERKGVDVQGPMWPGLVAAGVAAAAVAGILWATQVVRIGAPHPVLALDERGRWRPGIAWDVKVDLDNPGREWAGR